MGLGSNEEFGRCSILGSDEGFKVVTALQCKTHDNCDIYRVNKSYVRVSE